jgi:hypothetical protein
MMPHGEKSLGYDVVRQDACISWRRYLCSFFTDGPLTWEWKTVVTSTSAAESSNEAKRLLETSPRDTYAVRDTQGGLSDWHYDWEHSEARRRKEHWIGSLTTSVVLGVIIYSILLAASFSPQSCAFAAGSMAALHALISTFQNRIETLVMWSMFCVLLLLSYPAMKRVRAKQREHQQKVMGHTRAKPQVSFGCEAHQS